MKRCLLSISIILQSILVPAQNYGYSLNSPNNYGGPSKKCNNGSVVNFNQILNERIPYNLHLGNLPDTCKFQFNEAIKAYEVADKNEWITLANKACSYFEGWIEINPGTCQAGGPPPICPANHWIEKPFEAATKWTQLEKDVQQLREREIKKMICECWSLNLERQFNNDVEEHNNPYKGINEADASLPEKSDIALPCIGPPPPGYKCDNGILIHLSTKEKITGNDTFKVVGNWLLDKSIDYYIEKLLEFFPKNVSILYEGISNSPVFLFTMELTKSTGIGDESFQIEYANQMNRLLAELRSYRGLLAEHECNKRAQLFPGEANCQSHYEGDVMKDLLTLKQKMADHFKEFNLAYAGILNSNERKCEDCCYQALTVNHKWFCTYFLKVINTSLD